jgi:peptidoglycan/xylan/chitin deacetylase (PgdA/CDA1 family)
VTLPALDVYDGGPEAFAPRTRWVLETLLAPLGRAPRIVREREVAGGCALACAREPVPGVPTLPCVEEAMDLLLGGRPLPAGAFARRDGGAGEAAAAHSAREPIGAFPAPASGFAAPFDLVASAFALLACWDERTSLERDRFGRLPLSASTFAANPELRIEEPAVDGYVELLRKLLGARLEELGLDPLPPAGWMWGDGAAGDGPAGSAGFAVALTHDIDNVWRWTPRGFAATGYRSARALRHRRWNALRGELGDLREWLTWHLPRRTDPSWTFPQLLRGEDERGVSSTFFVIARHTHKQDGNQPREYQRRIPVALDLLRHGGREVGLHGNDADRLGAGALAGDRALLEERAGVAVEGLRYHYLRCLYHDTLPLVEKAGFAYDTSLAFAEREGFRCGASFPFRPYCVDEERPLRLLEIPLAVMDTTLTQPQYRALDAADGERATRDVLATVARTGGGVAVLWHNQRFDRRSARGYDDVYWRLVDWARGEGAFVGTAAALARRWVERTGAPS